MRIIGLLPTAFPRQSPWASSAGSLQALLEMAAEA